MESLPTIPMPHVNKDEDETRPISEGTPIRLGLILAILGIVGAGIIGSAVWVATQLTELKATVGAMQTTLNTLAVASATIRDDVSNHKTDDSRQWNDIKSRVQILEQSGSQAVRELAKEVNDLRNEFKVHEALSKQGGKP